MHLWSDVGNKRSSGVRETMNVEIRAGISQIIEENRDEMLSLLHKLVCCNSYYQNKLGIDTVPEMIT